MHQQLRRLAVLAAFVTVLSVLGTGIAVANARHDSAHSSVSNPSYQFVVTNAVARQSIAVARPRPRRHALTRPSTTRPRTVSGRRRTTRPIVIARSAHTTRQVAKRAVQPPQPTGPTGWSALDAAIARIHSYGTVPVHWVVSNKYGYWGTTDWYHATLYISPKVPASYLYDVAVHEWSHELSVLDYQGDVQAAVDAMNAHFGGGGASGLAGAENAADCMARLQGATWTHYTTCRNATWRSLAARLVNGQRLV